MAARTLPEDVLGRVTLVTGPEEFLGERAIEAVRAAVRRHDAEAEVSETMAATLTMAELGDLAAPSLFSTTRMVVVRRLEDLPEESAPGLLDYAASPAAEVALLLAHSGGAKGSGLLAKLRKLGPVSEVRSAALTAREYPGFVVSELRAHQVRIDPDAAELLVQAVGQDLRALSAAASQLAGDFAGQPLSTEMVGTYFGGRAEVKSFAVADHVVHGRAATALEELRWALERGTAPVLVTSAAGRRAAFAGQADGSSARAAVGRPRPGGRCAAVEDRRPAPSGPRLGRGRPGPGDPGRGPHRRGRQGPVLRPRLRPGEDGPRRRPLPAGALSRRTALRRRTPRGATPGGTAARVPRTRVVRAS